MRRVLHLLVDSSLRGGISRHVLNILCQLKKQAQSEYEFSVCTVFPKGELNEALESIGIRTYSLGANNFNHVGVFCSFGKVVRSVRPDIIHIHVITFWQWIYLALFGWHITKIFTIHSDYGRGTWKKRLMRCFLPLNIRKYIFVSNAVREAYDSNEFPGEVILNCIPALAEVDRDALPRELQLPKGTRVIGTVCQISEVKRPKAFVSVMSQILVRYMDVHAVVLGGGEEEQVRQLREIVDCYGVAKRFHFMGYRRDARELSAGLYVFVATSEREGLPTAMLESMSAGVPVAFMEGRGGLRDLARLNTGEKGPFGVTVADNDEQALVEGVCDLLDDDNKYSECSWNAVRVSRTEFDFETELRKLEHVYLEVGGQT